MLDNLVQALEPFDPVDLLKCVGALQLYPENTNCAIRIEVLSHAAISFPYVSGKPRISKNRLKRILNITPLGDSNYRLLEDPNTNLFTETITFIGGSYLIFPGILENASFILEHLNRAVFFSPEFEKDTKFRDSVFIINQFFLSISNELTKRLGYKRNLPVPDHYGDIKIPIDFNEKKNAVEFTLSEIKEIISPIPISAIEHLFAQLGEIDLAEYDLADNRLFSLPILIHEDRVVVYQPWMLLGTLRHEILKLADKYGLREKVAQEYHLAVSICVSESLSLFRWTPISIKLPKPKDSNHFPSSVWRFDVDKACYVIIYSDNLKEFNPNIVFDQDNDDSFKNMIEKHLTNIEDQFFLNYGEGFNEILILIIVSSLGRNMFLGMNKSHLRSNPNILALGAKDLQVITFLEGKDTLALYKFAQSVNKWKETTRVLSWSTLGEYEFYKKHMYSFYLGDEAPPDFLTLGVEFGKEMVENYSKSLDRHGVKALDSSGYIDVINIHQTPEYPIYAPAHFIGYQDFVLFVEGPIDIWLRVRSEIRKSVKLTHLHPDLHELADFLSYWLWQFRDAFSIIADKCDVLSPIIFDLSLDFYSNWELEDNSKSSKLAPPVEWNIDQTNRSICVIFSPTINSLLANPSNDGEMLTMQSVLESIVDYWNTFGYSQASQELSKNIKGILSPHINPYKKKLVVIDPAIYPQSIPLKGIAYRPVQEPDISIVLDLIGNYCTHELDLKPGKIPDSEISSVLNGIVGNLYENFTNLIASLSPINLLEFLINHYEVIVSVWTRRNLTITTQQACFKASEDYLTELANQISKINEASRSCRFVIEYVVSNPPNGLRPISLTAFDEIMALSSQIISRGSHSDMVEYSLYDIQLEMLNSGRIAYNYEELERILLGFISAHTREKLSSAQETFSEWWKSPRRSKDLPEDLIGFNDAFLEEFGFELLDLSLIISELGDQSDIEKFPGFINFEKKELIETLIKALGWDQNKVESLLDFLTLKPRNDFLNPPSPFDKTDVYPWRFSRSLSYIRRPLIEFEMESTLYIGWGVRHLFEASEYLFRTAFNGRIKPRYQSLKMRRWIGKQKKFSGNLFTSDVADLLSENQELIVNKNVRKIGNVRIGHPGDNLGDIDVLVIVPKRKRIYLIECKDLLLARTPIEIKREIEKLVLGSPNQPSTVEKHLKRQIWISDNLEILLSSYNLTASGKWKINSKIVVSNELMSPHFHNSPIQIISYLNFKDIFIPEILK